MEFLHCPLVKIRPVSLEKLKLRISHMGLQKGKRNHTGNLKNTLFPLNIIARLRAFPSSIASVLTSNRMTKHKSINLLPQGAKAMWSRNAVLGSSDLIQG